MEAIKEKQIEFNPILAKKYEESTAETSDAENETLPNDMSATYKIFDKYQNFHVNEPLGPSDDKIPFHVDRTHAGNLPVYTKFTHGGNRQRTIIRKIIGDTTALRQELAKIVSNSPMEEKQGQIIVSGLHSAKIKLWLTRLGF